MMSQSGSGPHLSMQSQNDASENLNVYWDDFKAGLDKVFQLQTLTRKEYMELYTNVYKYYTYVDRPKFTSSSPHTALTAPGISSSTNSKRGRTAGPPSVASGQSRRSNPSTASRPSSNRPSGGTASSNDFSASAQLESERPTENYCTAAGAKFYEKVREYLKTHVSQVRVGAETLHDDALLEYFHKQWFNYRFSSKVLDGLLSYVNNHFITRQRNEGKLNYYEIFQLALNTWRDHVVKSLAGRILDALLQEVARERRKEGAIQGTAALPHHPAEARTNVMLGRDAAPAGQNDLARVVQCYVEISGNDMVSNHDMDFIPPVPDLTVWDTMPSLCARLIHASKQLQNSVTAMAFLKAGQLGPSAVGGLGLPGVRDESGPSSSSHIPLPIGAPSSTTPGLLPPGGTSATIASSPLVGPTGAAPHTLHAHHYPLDAMMTPRVYMDYLEKGYLIDVKRFYDLESDDFLKKNSISEYLRKAECRILEEIERVNRCLHSSSHVKVLLVCENALVSRHRDTLTREFDRLLTMQHVEDLTRMYNLMSLTKDGLSVLVKSMEAHVANKGRQAVEAVAEKALNDPRIYVQALLSVYKDYERLLREAFQNNPDFSSSLDKGCTSFMNKNKVTTDLAKDARKSPELLAKYCDLLLKKGHRDANYESEDGLFRDVMIVHKYLEDKDVFQKFYSKCLCRRLVNGYSISEEAESEMITRLKEACGYEYTSKLQRMFQDMTTSQDLREPFRGYLEERKRTTGASYDVPAFDFHMMVLATNAWPLSPMEDIRLPPEMELCHRRFTEFYSFKHNGRKLSWIFTMGRGEMTPHYLKTRYIFQVSTLQMVLLVAFNDAVEYQCSQLQQLTGLQWNVLVQVLSVPLKHKVLKLTSSNSSGGQSSSSPMEVEQPHATTSSSNPQTSATPDTSNDLQITPESVVCLNMDFKSKKVRVNLNVPFKTEQKQETEHTIATVDHDRKMVIEATIVRIMKTRRELNHQELLNEVVKQVDKRFIPNIPMIKRCIDSLIEREFMTRKDNDREVYLYVA